MIARSKVPGSPAVSDAAEPLLGSLWASPGPAAVLSWPHPHSPASPTLGTHVSIPTRKHLLINIKVRRREVIVFLLRAQTLPKAGGETGFPEGK